MCLLAIAWKVHSEYPLLVSANRDEFLARPTQTAHFWPDQPEIFAGRDLQDGGSWMGITRKGRFAAVTNVRDPEAHREHARSRGLLVSQYLQDRRSAIDFCDSLQSEKAHYNGYNFIAFDRDRLVYQSNYTDQPEILKPGVYAISNATLYDPWPKTLSAADKLQQWLKNPATVNQLAQLLDDRTRAPDDRLPRTGVPLELERMLSAEFINSSDYATRSSTGFLVHRSGWAEYCEISHDSSEKTVKRQVLDDFIQGYQVLH